MGFYLSKLLESFYSGGEPARILMLGLDAAGKTTILYKVKLNETVTSIPTIGFNVETVTPCKGLTFTVWDIGGQGKIRQLWKRYYEGTKGLLYVVDSTDTERLSETKEELFAILDSEEMRGVPALIIANKQDLPNALSPAKLIDRLNLRNIVGHKWHIQGSCATTGEGVFESMEYLARMVKEFDREH